MCVWHAACASCILMFFGSSLCEHRLISLWNCHWLLIRRSEKVRVPFTCFVSIRQCRDGQWRSNFWAVRFSTAALSHMNLWTHRFFPQDAVSVSPHRRVSHSSAPKVSSDSYTVFRLLFIHFTLHVVLALLWLLGVLFMLCVSVCSVCVCVCVFVELGGAFVSQHALCRIRVSAEGRLIRRRVRQKAASRCMNTHESSFYELVSGQMSHLMLQNKLKWCLEKFEYLNNSCTEVKNIQV